MLRLADDKLVPNVTHMAQVIIQMGDHTDTIWALITDLGKYDIILGMPWLEEHNPSTSYRDRSFTFYSDHCRTNCLHKHRPVTVYSPGVRSRDKVQPNKIPHDHGDIQEVSAFAMVEELDKPDHELVTMWPEHFELLEQPEEQDEYLMVSAISHCIDAISADDFEKFFSKSRRPPTTIAELYQRLPKHYKQHVELFNPKLANKLPPHRDVDHGIDLVPGAKPPAKKAYGLSREQAQVVKSYIDDMLGKGFIRHSSSPFAAPVLIVKKPGGGLRVCVDYRALNELTIKNRNAPPLIRDTLARLCHAKIYSKFDIIAAFNDIRMRPGDEGKTAFTTRYGLFEYVVMPFGLCNAPATFQTLINKVLGEYLDDFCSAYLDDILVYSNSEEEHITHVKKVLSKLEEAGLYLDIDKCEFHVTSIKYLGLIITTDGIQMDPDKIKAILDWETPRSLRDVQAFLGFANFYRRFIHKYSHIAKPLTALTLAINKGKPLPWTPNGPEDSAFKQLKQAFASMPVLRHFDPNLETWLETDASDFVVAAILSQRGPDGVLHPVAYMSKTMSPAECNYEIYDKELLAIVRAFEEWHPECAGTPIEEPIKVISDHRNLETFMSTKQLNRRQARWAEFLSEFNFKITYRPGTLGAKPDSLTRRSQDLPASAEDPRYKFQRQTILKEHNVDATLTKNASLETGITNAITLAPLLQSDRSMRLAEVTSMIYGLAELELLPVESQEAPLPASEPDRDEGPITSDQLLTKVREACANDKAIQAIVKAKQAGDRKIPPGLRKDWHLELGDCVIKDGIIYYKGRILVPLDKELRTAIIRHHHDGPLSGHGGRKPTYLAVTRFYWWPQVTDSVKSYVRSCLACKYAKASRDPKQGLLKPLPIPDHYWQDIACDFVTSLPPCRVGGKIYRHILVVVDRLSKMKRFIPMDSLETTAVVQAFIDFIWRSEGFPISIVSDRGSQFVAHFWQRLNKRLGTKIKLSTAFHPETDGQTENANAFLKQYLRAYVSHNQDDWVGHLATAEFVANSLPSESTGIAPFLATKGYLPKSGLEPPEDLPADTTPDARRDIRLADQAAEKIEALRSYLREELTWAQAKQADFANKHRAPAPEIKVGDKVMLDTRNLKTDRPSKSLDHKQIGPYEIVRVINNAAYELKLPDSMKKTHPVFHPWLLHLDKSTPLPGQRRDAPPPVTTTEGYTTHYVKEIVDSRLNGRVKDRNPNPARDPTDRTTERMLQYKVAYEDHQDYNRKPDWQDYTDVEDCPDFVADFHHKYPNKPGPHWTFKTPEDWEPVT